MTEALQVQADLTKIKSPAKEIRLATVFSGIGAIEYALKRLRWSYKVVFACDNDKFVKESYFANYKISEKHWHDDVVELAKIGEQYKNKVDLFVGGSPCQPFSFVGSKAGLEDTRGTLFHDFAELVDKIKPPVFIYENVKGLLDHDGGRTWKVMRDVFDSLGYKIHQSTLNAKNYGMPQHRERLFVVGFKDHNATFEFPKPQKLKLKMQDFLQDSPHPQGLSTEEKNKLKKFRDKQEEIEEKYYLSDKVAKYVLASGTKNFYSKPETDLEVARPLLATMHKMHRAGVDNYISTSVRGWNKPDGKNDLRKLTPRECLRLMGFDDDFEIVCSNLQIFRQSGNSIVVDVLMSILREIYK